MSNQVVKGAEMNNDKSKSVRQKRSKVYKNAKIPDEFELFLKFLIFFFSFQFLLCSKFFHAKTRNHDYKKLSFENS